MISLGILKQKAQRHKLAHFLVASGLVLASLAVMVIGIYVPILGIPFSGIALVALGATGLGLGGVVTLMYGADLLTVSETEQKLDELVEHEKKLRMAFKDHPELVEKLRSESISYEIQK